MSSQPAPTLPSASLLRRQRPTLVLAVGVVLTVLWAGQDGARQDHAITVAIYSLMAISVALGYGQAGVLSVSQSAFAALGAYSTAILTTRFGLHPLVGLVVAILVPAAVAYPLARIVGRLSHLALAIATLVFGSIVLIVLRDGGDFTGGYNGISAIPSLPWASTLQDYMVFAWAVVVIVVAGYANLVHSSHGRGLQTIRYDALRARADGVGVAHRVASVFSLAAAVAGLAGWLYAHYVSFLAPESLSSTLSITVILMAVVGGTGYVLGPVVGTAILYGLQNALPSESAQGLVYGCALVVALVVAPEGLLGLGDRLWLLLRLRVHRTAPEPSEAVVTDVPSSPAGAHR